MNHRYCFFPERYSESCTFFFTYVSFLFSYSILILLVCGSRLSLRCINWNRIYLPHVFFVYTITYPCPGHDDASRFHTCNTDARPPISEDATKVLKPLVCIASLSVTTTASMMATTATNDAAVKHESICSPDIYPNGLPS